MKKDLLIIVMSSLLTRLKRIDRVSRECAQLREDLNALRAEVRLATSTPLLSSDGIAAAIVVDVLLQHGDIGLYLSSLAREVEKTPEMTRKLMQRILQVLTFLEVIQRNSQQKSYRVKPACWNEAQAWSRANPKPKDKTKQKPAVTATLVAVAPDKFELRCSNGNVYSRTRQRDLFALADQRKIQILKEVSYEETKQTPHRLTVVPCEHTKS